MQVANSHVFSSQTENRASTKSNVSGHKRQPSLSKYASRQIMQKKMG